MGVYIGLSSLEILSYEVLELSTKYLGLGLNPKILVTEGSNAMPRSDREIRTHVIYALSSKAVSQPKLFGSNSG